jgi:hypothetical protein
VLEPAGALRMGGETGKYVRRVLLASMGSKP